MELQKVIFQTSQKLLASQAYTPVTLSSNEPECRWNENLLYIPGHS